MEDFYKKLEKEYGIDRESFKKLAVIGVIALILAGIGIFWLLDSMKVKTLPYNELKAKVEGLWNQAKSKGATTEADYRKYITDRLTQVNYRQYELDVTTNGVEVIDRVASLNKYGFFFDVPYQIIITNNDGMYTKYALIFHEDGTADTYIANEETQYYLVCDTLQNERNLKYETRFVKLDGYDLQFSADGFDIVITRVPEEGEEINEEDIPKYSATVTYDPEHGIFREYVYAGVLEEMQAMVALSASDKLTIVQETGTKELQIRTDCDDHRIIYEGGVFATMSMDGKTLKIGSDILQISETPYTYNVEQPKYPGMKVKLVNGSTVDGLRAGNPKTGDIVIYNDYMYVCNKNYVKDEWVVFNEDESKPQWGVQVLGTDYELVADMEDEIFGVPVTMVTYTYANCLMLADAPKISTNAKDMSFAFSYCSSLKYAPRIPDGVKDMTNTFSGCSVMKTASVLPSGVKTLVKTFEKCSELVSPVKIPENVEDITCMFDGCKKMTGNLKIDSNKIEKYDSCFGGTDELIILSGKCEEEKLRLYAATSGGKNVKLSTDPEVDTGDGFTEINQ